MEKQNVWVYKYGGPWDNEGVVIFTNYEDAVARLKADVEERLGPWDEIEYGENKEVEYREETYVLTSSDKYVNVIGAAEVDGKGFMF